MSKERISILGCGWLGVPLGKYLANKGHLVSGSVTSKDGFHVLETNGIKPFRIILTEHSVEADNYAFFDADVLIVSVPPRRIEAIEKVYPAQIEQIVPLIKSHQIKKVIFISSTSVYPENKNVATESSSLEPNKASGKALISAESLLIRCTEFKTTVLRFGGLIGADRNPARFLQKSGRPVSNVPVNLIHLDDCVGIISAVISNETWDEVLNACCPQHPSKKEFYGKAAALENLPPPIFSDEDGEYKIVDSSKLIRLLNYTFKFDSPIDYLSSLAVNS
jgi:hypothetical protein